MNRLRTKYQTEILPKLQQQLKMSNSLSVPKLTKVVINVGVTDQQHREESLTNVMNQIATITGQKPVRRVARQSIATFRLRQGDPVGVSVTLRGERMYQFLDKLISIVLPRVKDFQGVPTKSFDGQGNYNLGIREQITFPEIDYDKIDRIRGMQITIVTSAQTDEQGRALLTLLGMPFEKGDN